MASSTTTTDTSANMPPPTTTATADFVEKPMLAHTTTSSLHSSSRSSMDHDLEKAETAPVTQSPSATAADESRMARTTTTESEKEPEYPPRRKLIPILASVYLAFFLVALDRTILATAIPRITDQFHSLGDVGWYASAYMLTGCAFQLLFGRIYTFYSPKTVFLIVIFIFEVGSAISGAAPNSTAFIIGRAIAGTGASGIFAGAIIIIMHVVPLKTRALLQGLIGAIFGISSVAGPLMGGAFTTNVSWRWCFYINLPIGGLAFVILVFFLELPQRRQKKVPLREQLNLLDPIGTAIFLPSIVCLLLALQWGGSTYNWGNARIIVLLVLGLLGVAAFLAVQVWRKEHATIPLRVLRQRSIAAGSWAQFCIGSSMMVVVYYLPIWFQAIKNVSAVKSGIDILPLMMGVVVSSIGAGIIINRVGYYTPFMIASSVLMAIGSGLLTTFTPNTSHSMWIGYQVICGAGLGMGIQQASLAAQACLPRKDAAMGVSMIMFCQQFGGAIFVSVAQNIFDNELGSHLAGIGGLDAGKIVNTGATELRDVVQSDLLPRVLDVYNGAIVKVFTISVAMACFSFIGTVLMEWKDIRKVKQGAKKAAEATPAKEGEVAEKQ